MKIWNSCLGKSQGKLREFFSVRLVDTLYESKGCRNFQHICPGHQWCPSGLSGRAPPILNMSTLLLMLSSFFNKIFADNLKVYLGFNKEASVLNVAELGGY